MKRILIIGGGAAGMMAAAAARSRGAKVVLLEKNEKTGKKIYITGKGRCNLTNACAPEDFFRNVVSNNKFLYSAFYQMDNQAVMDFFEKAGCGLKVERGERVFPVSDHSSDVIAALNRKLEREGVRICLRTAVSQILSDPGMPEKVSGVRLSDGRVLSADAVIVATGGSSYTSTGSDGDGYKFAQRAGHTVSKLRPALVPLVVREAWCREMQGLSLKNVSLSLKSGKKKIYEGFGEMLFTHFGVSGPLVLSASSYYAKSFHNCEAALSIDLKPALSAEQLDKRILRDFEDSKCRRFKNSLDRLLPSKMIQVIVALSGISPEKRVSDITRKERENLAGLLKNLTMTVTGTRGFQEAVVTQGGVDVKEINPSTMESRKLSGLYFAGEVLDVDALTGGFNLQIAWSTGYLAGISAAGSKIIGKEREQ